MNFFAETTTTGGDSCLKLFVEASSLLLNDYNENKVHKISVDSGKFSSYLPYEENTKLSIKNKTSLIDKRNENQSKSCNC